MKNNLFYTLLLISLGATACHNAATSPIADTMFCDDTNGKKQAYCYKWQTPPSNDTYRILIYEQLTYDEQTEPILVLDALFEYKTPSQKTLDFATFRQTLAQYQPAHDNISPDEVGILNDKHQLRLLRADSSAYDVLESTTVYYDKYAP